MRSAVARARLVGWARNESTTAFARIPGFAAVVNQRPARRLWLFERGVTGRPRRGCDTYPPPFSDLAACSFVGLRSSWVDRRGDGDTSAVRKTTPGGTKCSVRAPEGCFFYLHC